MSQNSTGLPIQGATTSSTRLEYVIREGNETHWPMVADAWVNSHRASGRQTKLSEKSTFFPHHHRLIDKLLRDPTVHVRVAAPRDDDFTAYGFAVVQGDFVHMVYVKAPFRRIGVAKNLLAGFKAEGTTFTYWTRDVAQWIHEKYPALKYNPFWTEKP